MPVRGSVLVATVRVEHSVTGEAMGPLRVELLEPIWSGWTVLYRRGRAALVCDAESLSAQPAESRVAVYLDDPLVRSLLASDIEGPTPEVTCADAGKCLLAGDGLERGAEEDHVSRDQSAESGKLGIVTVKPDIGAEHVIHARPTATTLEVLPVDEFGRGVRGLALEVRGSGDAKSVPLSEVHWSCIHSMLATEAVYRSCGPRVWDARYYPFQIFADDMRVGERVVNYRTRVTRHRLVVPMTHSRA